MRLVAYLLGLGLLFASVLVVRIALDFTRLAPAIGVVVWALAGALVLLVGSQVFAAWRGGPGVDPRVLSTRARAGLALAVPFALAGSQLDCMGSLLSGCNPACELLSTYVAPAVALVALLHAALGWRGTAIAMLVLAFPLLVPNCTCRNPVNAYWIDLLGKSPACYAASFAVTLVASSALVTGRHPKASLAISWGTVSVLAVFWIGHHFFDWPW